MASLTQKLKRTQERLTATAAQAQGTEVDDASLRKRLSQVREFDWGLGNSGSQLASHPYNDADMYGVSD